MILLLPVPFPCRQPWSFKIHLVLVKNGRWYRAAPEQGHFGAQCNLGVCYCYGHGVVEEFYSQAVHWYGKAVAQGHRVDKIGKH
eukprot:scaffold1902_cov169-Ochromonas_danica.AAC.4